jgi:outer membrane receptor protein involved in Fe transport
VGSNPFGRQPISAECAEFLEVQAGLTNEFVLDVGTAYVSGPLFDLPAGAVQTVLGVEYRGFSYALDPGAAGGPISGFNAQNPAGGENSFLDVFTEALFPLVPGLDVTVGARWSRSQFVDIVKAEEGDSRVDSTYKAEMTWQIADPVMLRASYQRAVRAPNFGELFDGGGSAPQYFDPCSVGTAARTGPDGASVEALCTANGVGAIATYVQTPGTQLSITTTGNTDLEPEGADTYTVGAVFNSPWQDIDLRASIDYYHINIQDVILAPSPNVVIADCFNYYGNNTTYSNEQENCAAIVRGGGDALFLNGPNDDGTYPGINGGGVEVSGIDIQVDYGLDLGGAGALNFNALLSHVIEWVQQDADDLPAIDYAGTVTFFGEGLGLGGSVPEWRLTLNTSWNVSDFTFYLRNRYISEMDNRASVIFPGESFTGADSIWYHDIAAQWDMTENASLRVGVNNVLDEQPPQYRPNVQSGTEPSLYDVVGRRAFLQVNLRY